MPGWSDDDEEEGACNEVNSEDQINSLKEDGVIFKIEAAKPSSTSSILQHDLELEVI